MNANETENAKYERQRAAILRSYNSEPVTRHPWIYDACKRTWVKS